MTGSIKQCNKEDNKDCNWFIIQNVLNKLKEEQKKYEWNDYEFPVPRHKIASYHAYGNAIDIINKEMEHFENDSSA